TQSAVGSVIETSTTARPPLPERGTHPATRSTNHTTRRGFVFRQLRDSRSRAELRDADEPIPITVTYVEQVIFDGATAGPQHASRNSPPSEDVLPIKLAKFGVGPVIRVA